MKTWTIISWVFVGILTGINIFIFLKLKSAADQMLKTAFPGAKNMNEALSQMQGMMNAASRMGKGMPGGARGPGQNPQLKQAMDMLQQIQKGNKK